MAATSIKLVKITGGAAVAVSIPGFWNALRHGQVGLSDDVIIVDEVQYKLSSVEVVSGGAAGGISLAQTNVTGLAQVVGTSVFAKITGASTFLEQGGNFNNGGADNLRIKYIGADPKLITFFWAVQIREDPAGAGADGTLNVQLDVNGILAGLVPDSNTTAGVDGGHGGTSSGSFTILAAQNDFFELWVNRNTGGGDGAVEGVIFQAELK